MPRKPADKDQSGVTDRVIEAVNTGRGGPFTKDQQRMVDQLRAERTDAVGDDAPKLPRRD